MIKVCLDVFSPLPVPAVRGGAVETLYEILMEENDKYGKLDLIIVSNYDKEAQRLSQKYKNSRVIYVKKHDFTKRIYNRIICLISKCVKLKYPLNQYDSMKENMALYQAHADYYVTNGCGINYYPIMKRVGRDHMYYYIHCESFGNQYSDVVFGHTISVSNFIRKQYYTTAKSSINDGVVVLNCTDENQFQQRISENQKLDLRMKIGIQKEDFVVLYSGRIAENKGVHVLIEAMKYFDNNIKLLICGGVSSGLQLQDAYLKKIRESISGKNNIIYIGYVPHEEMYQYSQIADIQVVPSLCEEAAGLVTIEAMYSGLPLIITRSGGMPEYVDDQCAIILERTSNLCEEIASSISKLKQDVSLRESMSQAAMFRARKYTRKDYYDDFVACFINHQL